MQQRQPDPRDNQSNDQQSLQRNDQQSPQVQPGSQGVAQANEQPQVQKKSDNPYEFNDYETKMFGSYSTDTAIARAWSRALRSKHNVGRPTGEEMESDQEGFLTQEFQYGYALYEVPELDKDGKPKNNVNNTVVFYDGHGEIYRDSGL